MPIYGLIGDFELAAIDNDTKIKLLHPNEYSRVTDIDIADNDSFRPQKKFWKVRYGIFMKSERGAEQSLYITISIEKSQRILECLRMFKSDPIYLGALYPDWPDNWRINDLPPRTGTENPPDFKPIMKLASSEIEPFLKLYHKFNIISKTGNSYFFLVSLKKFSAVYEDKIVEDKITNMSMVLEHLLTSGAGELQFKLSQRGGMFLGQTEEQREYFWNIIKRCYEIRSEIVHGKKRKTFTQISGENVTDETVLLELEKITRESLCKILSLLYNGRSQSELIKILDQSSVNRNRLGELDEILKDT